MPDTADHRVHCHQIATELRRQGKPFWSGQVDVSDVFHDDDLAFAQKRDAIVRRIKRLPQVKTAQDVVDNHPESDGYFEAEDLIVLVEEMADAEDVEHFDCVWSAFYDWADIARVWVKTF
jgi:hypothetical protein